MKLFLDTNVLFDYISNKPPYCEDAFNLTIMSAFDDAQLFVSSKSFTDVFYSMKKFRSPDVIQNSFLDCLEVFNVYPLSADDIYSACKLGCEDFEDALIAVCANRAGVDYLVSRDVQLMPTIIEVRTPEQIITMMAERGITYTEVDLTVIE